MALFDRTSERLKRLRAQSHGFVGMAGEPVAEDPHRHLPDPVQSGHAHPGSRELRAQAVHRLQVGLFGLAAMLLLVSLANVIMERVQTADRSAISASPTGLPGASPSATAANDPLVDMGVAPEVPVDGDGAAHKPARNAPAH